VPPSAIAWIEDIAPVPCMSGEAGKWTGERPSSTNRLAIAPTPAASSGIGSPCTAYIVSPSVPNRSRRRHMTPFGMPVVPPV